jgi:hypothetical protein
MISSLMALALAALWPQGAKAGGEVPMRGEATSPSRVAALYAHLPLSFEINQGQADPRVKYLAHGQGYTLWLTADQAVLALRSSAELSTSALPVIRLKLVGSDPAPSVWGEQPLPGRSNYFLGNDPKKWRTNIPIYAKVKYANVYPGVDLVYYGNQGQLEYDFVVQPGADPHSIQLAVSSDEQVGSRQKAVGSTRETQDRAPAGQSAIDNRPSSIPVPLRIDGNGDLVVGTEGGEVIFHKPLVYQPRTDYEPRTKNQEPRTVNKKVIDGRYALQGDRVTFALGDYDRRQPLVIDPVLSYSTYLGGTGGDVAYGIAVDSSGNAYITGTTGSVDFPIVSAEQPTYGGSGDAFVTKLNPTGSGIIYSTYLGGSGPDTGNAIAVDSSGNVYVAGTTSSAGFPTTVNAFQTVYGGPGVAQTGNIPQSNGFISKLNPTGTTLLYSSYLGGSTVAGGRPADSIQAVAVDSSGAAYLTGSEESTDFPVVNPLQIGNNGGSDAFVTKVNPSGDALDYSTYLGGSGADVGRAIAVDASGDVFLAGYTISSNFPTQNAYQSTSPSSGNAHAFLTELYPSGTSLVFSTYFGGNGQDRAFGMALDSQGNIYLAGDTTSTDFPITANAFQSMNQGQGDAFVSKLTPGAASVVYSTFLGGTAADQATSIALDSKNNAYVTGFTSSSNFPTLTPLQAVLVNSGASTCSSGVCPDAFVSAFNTSGAAIYSTFLGGSNADLGQAIAADSAGNAYVAGSTTSSNFPVILGALEGTLVATGTNSNAFVAKISQTDAPGVAITPQQLNFGNEALNSTSNPQDLTLINAGSASLFITSIEAGANFGATDDCGTLLPPAGGNCTIQVTFTPTTLGSTTNQITINDDAAGSPHRVVVTGTGVASSAGALTLSPSTLSFPPQSVGVTSPPQVVRLSNTSLAAVTLTAPITVSGDFSQTNNCGSIPSVLEVGASCTITVFFTPTTSGSRTGSVSITANTGGVSVSLTGTGNPAFTLSANARATTIVIGTTTATFTISASAPSSFTSYITLSCASGATCTFNPTSIYAGQSSTLTVTSLSATTTNPLNVTVTGTAQTQTSNVALSVFLSDFSVAVTPYLVNIAAGQAATYTITVTPINGFNQVVQLGVSGLPQATTATLNPPAVMVPGTVPVTALATLTTTVQTTRLWWPFPSSRVHPHFPVPGFPPWALFLAALALLATLVASVTGRMPTRKRAWAAVGGAMLLFFAALLASCNDYPTTPPVSQQITGTPFGVFTITVTGTMCITGPCTGSKNGSVTRLTTMNLSVGP